MNNKYNAIKYNKTTEMIGMTNNGENYTNSLACTESVWTLSDGDNFLIKNIS